MNKKIIYNTKNHVNYMYKLTKILIQIKYKNDASV
jgi:hypothetical protein